VSCPFYTNGLCYNPSVVSTYGRPSSAVVKQEVCNTKSYRECDYFADPPDQEVPKEVYPIIHKIACTVYSECPNFLVRRFGEEDCVAYCKAVEKYIPRNSVAKCVELWKNCPYLSLTGEK
jgi:hypothetical protein